MSLFLPNCIKAMRKTQIPSSCVTKYAKITKSHPKTGCFPDHVIVLNHAFTP